MKFKPTPLFIVSAGLLLYGLYMLIFINPGEEGWGTLLAMVIIGGGLIGLFIYIILCAVLKNKVWTQVGLEIVLITGVLFFEFKKSGRFEFRLTHKYSGYVMVVYGVDKKPKLPTRFFANKIKIKVPVSGIIVTSSAPKENYSEPAIFIDSTLGPIQNLPAPLTRYDIPYSTETLFCGDKTYLIEIWFIKDKPNWSSKEDSINRLDLKLTAACMLTNN